MFLGDGSTDEFIGEGGDDIFVGSAGINKLEGMSGFDWATYKDNRRRGGHWADLLLNAFDEFPLPPPLSALDQYGNVEGLSGTAFNDTLYGSDVTAADMPLGRQHAGSVLTADRNRDDRRARRMSARRRRDGTSTVATSSWAATATTPSPAAAATTSSTATSG